MGSARFPKRARLTRPAEFRRVFRDARRLSGDGLLMLVRPNTLGRPRLGLAISRRAAPGAVARNRAKRAIRESFRHQREWLGGMDIVVIGQPGLGRKTGPALRATLETLWTRLRSCKRS